MSDSDVRDEDFSKHKVVYVKSEILDKPQSQESDNAVFPQSPKSPADWQPAAVTQFFKVLHKQMVSFNDGEIFSKKMIFENCSEHLKKHGFVFTHSQCENKWKAMKRRFYNNQRYSHKLRNIDRKVMYFDEIENILKIDRPYYMEEIKEINKRKADHKLQFKQTENEDETMEMDDEEMIVERLSDYEPQNPSSEMGKVENLVKQHIEKTNMMFEAVSNNQQQTLIYLEALDKKDKEKLIMTEKKLAIKEELLRQTRMQNSLIAKLVRKIGSEGSGDHNK